MMRVYYQLSKSPATFDYVNFLVRAEQERIARQQDSISVRISFGIREQSPRDIAFSPERKLWRINNLLIPLSRCLPSVCDVAIGDGAQTIGYLPFRDPQSPVLEAPDSARALVRAYLKDKRKPVSITIRQSDFEHQRNSNIQAWATVAEWLISKGYTPIFVPDTESELIGQSQKWETIGATSYPAAALYPEIRLALFEHCVVNLMSAGGPMEVALNADVPIMIWKLLVDGLPMNSIENINRRALTKNWGPKKRIYLEQDEEKTIITHLASELPHFDKLREAA